MSRHQRRANKSKAKRDVLTKADVDRTIEMLAAIGFLRDTGERRNGQVVWERTDPGLAYDAEGPSEKQIAQLLLATPRNRLIELWLSEEDGERAVAESTLDPDRLSDDAVRLLCVLVKDLRGLKHPNRKNREFEPGVVPRAFCDLIGERRTQNAMTELEAADPEMLAFSKHGILAMTVYSMALDTDAMHKRTRALAKRYELSEDDVWLLRRYDWCLERNPARAKLMERNDPTLPAKYAEAKLKAEKFKAERKQKNQSR